MLSNTNIFAIWKIVENTQKYSMEKLPSWSHLACKEKVFLPVAHDSDQAAFKLLFPYYFSIPPHAPFAERPCLPWHQLAKQFTSGVPHLAWLNSLPSGEQWISQITKSS